MFRSSPEIGLRCAIVLSFLALCPFSVTRAADAAAGRQTKGSVQMKCGAHIECVTPDGRSAKVSRVPVTDPNAIALIMEDDTVTCLLQEGETSFVIELPKASSLDRLTFLNENGTAHGELKIAVSNHRLAANSPEWTEVEGVIPFARKRLFGVSLLGIEAKFVRLSFHVEKSEGLAAASFHGQKEIGNSGRLVIGQSEFFQSSGLDAALNSKFANQHARVDAILLSSNSTSVGPLSR